MTVEEGRNNYLVSILSDSCVIETLSAAVSKFPKGDRDIKFISILIQKLETLFTLFKTRFEKVSEIMKADMWNL